MTGLLRDQVTGEMHAVTARGLRELEDALGAINMRREGQALDATTGAMSRVLAFSATLSGLAAENMVRGAGGCSWTSADASSVPRRWLTRSPARWSSRASRNSPHAWSMDSAWHWNCANLSITYRSRYLAVLQPAPALDLMLADDGNPRGLAFQLAAIRALLGEIAGGADVALVVAAAALQDEPPAMVGMIGEAADQSVAALFLPARLRALRDGVAELSDRVSRRYFALLPTARTVGIEAPRRPRRGAA